MTELIEYNLSNIGEKLEEIYAHRNLKVNAFGGAAPVQAYGEVDGMRFYFRFRSNHARLKLGLVNEEIDRLHAQRVDEDRAERLSKVESRRVFGPLTISDHMEFKSLTRVSEPQAPDSPYYFPYVIEQMADVYDVVKNGDCYTGHLTQSEAIQVFGELLDKLEEQPDHVRLHPETKIWLYEGRAALQKHLGNV